MNDDEQRRYSYAIDEIYALRAILASNARILEAHLDLKSIPKSRPARVAAFDRWLTTHDREVAAKAWDEGSRHGNGRCLFARDGDPCPNNPYREAP